jgi:geranylgeranyl reductase
MVKLETFDVAVIGGGPSGATAAKGLADAGYSVLLLDRAGRIKPCGGAIPPRLIKDFCIPDELLAARITSARIVSPIGKRADMPINGGFVGMVDREVFDEWLRQRAVDSGATRRTGTFEALSRDTDGTSVITYRQRTASGAQTIAHTRACCVIGADGAKSAVVREAIPGASRTPFVFAYHEIIRVPKSADAAETFEAARCDVYYNGRFSPDFYAWIFPHGDTASVGTGTAIKGVSLRTLVGDLRRKTGLDTFETIRREGAPIPMRPLKRWDNGRDVVVVGDAAGVVAPASGEGIYYAMYSGRLASDAAAVFLETGDASALSTVRKRFMKAHGKVFFVLGIMQHFWYRNDDRRERFVNMCGDPDVQELTWQAYMHKELVRAKPAAHARIFLKDLAHIFGLVSP